MKQSLTLLALMAATATSALAGTPTIAPVAVTPATPVQAWTPALAFSAVGAFAYQSVNPNLWGGRITFSMYKAATPKFTHEVNVAISALAGNDTFDGVKLDVSDIPLTLGYNANYRIADKWTAFAGAKVGMSYFDAEVSEGNYKQSDSDLGFQWSVGTGVKYEWRKDVDIILSYEFNRCYADLDSKMPYSNVNVGYHTITAGLVFWF